MQDVGEALENDALVGVLQLVLVAGKVLVLAVELLDLDVVLEAVLEALIPAHVELHVPEVLDPARLVGHVNARDVRLDLAAEHLGQRLLKLGSLHLLAHAVDELPREFLDILLLENVARFPAKRLCQLGSADGGGRSLELVKESLQRVGAVVHILVLVCRDAVDDLPEGIGEV